jgi:hypothetical protein
MTGLSIGAITGLFVALTSTEVDYSRKNTFFGGYHKNSTALFPLTGYTSVAGIVVGSALGSLIKHESWERVELAPPTPGLRKLSADRQY